jgi:chemotaxis protein histidine kinase CheA
MVEELRGRIEVSGAPGEGSTFAVTLPFVPLDAADGVAEAS